MVASMEESQSGCVLAMDQGALALFDCCRDTLIALVHSLQQVQIAGSSGRLHNGGYTLTPKVDTHRERSFCREREAI